MLVTSTAASAQDAGVGKRVEKLEKEMQAVQRKVFPGGDPRFFEGEIQGGNPTTTTTSGASTPISDLTTRIDALESQLASLTGQSEQNAFKLRELEKQFTAFKAEAAAREAADVTATPASIAPAPAKPMVTTTAAVATPKPAATVTKPVVLTPASTTKPAATKPAAVAAATPAKPSAARLALVKAVEIPASGNETEDAYNYGFRLWSAKLYPEAQAQLKKVVERWPRHNRASYAQNLLGRAYLDEGKPSLATVAFYNNYKDRPQGERAPHSLMYMGVSLDKLGRKADACKAFKELDDVYGATMPGDVKSDAAAAKTKAGC